MNEMAYRILSNPKRFSQSYKPKISLTKFIIGTIVCAGILGAVAIYSLHKPFSIEEINPSVSNLTTAREEYNQAILNNESMEIINGIEAVVEDLEAGREF